MFFKRSLFFLIILLFILSIYNDITIGTSMLTENKSSDIQTTHTNMTDNEIMIIKVHLQPGDTVLSVTEEINEWQGSLDVSQVINDFQYINPHVDPYQLQPNQAYFFPIYGVYHP